MNQEFFSVLVQVVAALGLAGIILLLSILMGKRSSFASLRTFLTNAA